MLPTDPDGCPLCEREQDPFGTGDTWYYEYNCDYPYSCYYDGHPDPANPTDEEEE